MSPEVARLRHADPYDQCRLSGLKRKQRGHRETVAFDPTETLADERQTRRRSRALRRRSRLSVILTLIRIKVRHDFCDLPLRKDLELAERGLLCPSIAGPTISLLSFDMR